MEIIDLIKKRHSVRKYIDRPIPEEAINKIIEAGIWGPSIPGFLGIQPWKFIVISNKDKICKVANIVLEKSRISKAGINFLLNSAYKTISGASALILIYNSGGFESFAHKYKEVYNNVKEIIPKAELSAISAAIQNMVIVAESLSIGSCWLDTPTFCMKEINMALDIKNELVAILSLGYPAEKSRRASRKLISETVRYIK